MAQTVANLADALKEVWTSDRLEKQFYDENPILDRMERAHRSTIGGVASVPIHKGRNGGFSVLGPAGGTLNAADAQKIDKAQYGLSYLWEQIELQFGALNQADGGSDSTVEALDLEIKGAASDLSKQATRQLVTDATGYIAETAAATSVNVIPLVTPANAGRGYDAIVRGHLYPGLTVDIGSASNPTSVAQARTIISVAENATTPTITISGAAITTTTGLFVSISGARSGSSTFELNGLRQIAGSNSTLGTLNPANLGEEFWTPAFVDNTAGTNSTLTLDLLLGYRQRVAQKTGTKNTLIVTSLQNQANFESLLQNQVRFTNPDQLKAGNATVTWNGMEFMGLPDVYSTDLFFLTIEDFEIIVGGGYPKPTWMSEVEGANRGLIHTPGTTKFNDSLVYALQIGVKRRNSHGANTVLTA